jgi:hypothetical protein
VLVRIIVERARQRGGAIPWTIPDFDRSEIRTSGPIRDHDDFMVSLDNLLRLRILVHEPLGRDARRGTSNSIFFDIKLSTYGAKFARAVRRDDESATSSSGVNTESLRKNG